ncbi:MAG: hypothetical protein NWE75_00885 [Candidatus Bathyarchaeota archaeon]|nr:hypothetical protein [Candidatus Bathyarchaeota archaeon]
MGYVPIRNVVTRALVRSLSSEIVDHILRHMDLTMRPGREEERKGGTQL